MIGNLKRIFSKLLNFRVFLLFNSFIFCCKILYSFYIGFSGLHFEDWAIANNLAKYGEYSEFINIGPTAYKLPVYPLFLSFFVKWFPMYAKEIVTIVQHVIYFIIPILVIKIGSLVFNKNTGILAAYIFIFSPGYFYYSNVMEATNIFIPIFLLWIYLYSLIYYEKWNKVTHYITFGVITTLLALTQVVAVPIIGLGLLALLVFKKISIKHVLLVIFVASLSYSPWIIRNKIVFDKIIVSKTPVWQNIYFSFTSKVNVIDELKLISDQHQSYTFQARRKIDEFKMEEIYREETERVLVGNGNLVFKKWAQNALLLWYVPLRYYYDNSLSIVLGRKMFVVFMNIFSIAAMLYFYKVGRRRLVLGFLMVFIGFTIPYMIGHVANTRFKLDFEYLQYILVAAYLYSWTTNRIIYKNPPYA